ncbi:MAG TPA: GtrA family protein [Sedimenticola sp.]|nr:GtrA family protein [Sedimenticola sp.]
MIRTGSVTVDQFLRYAVVGLGSNLLLYLAYLLLTGLGMGPKTAMTLLYALGVAQTFIFNRKWSFGHKGRARTAFLRYLASYAIGYLLNWVVLWVCVDRLGLPHQPVQGAMILLLALFLFALQKFWVFREPVQQEGVLP